MCQSTIVEGQTHLVVYRCEKLTYEYRRYTACREGPPIPMCCNIGTLAPLNLYGIMQEKACSSLVTGSLLNNGEAGW